MPLAVVSDILSKLISSVAWLGALPNVRFVTTPDSERYERCGYTPGLKFIAVGMPGLKTAIILNLLCYGWMVIVVVYLKSLSCHVWRHRVMLDDVFPSSQLLTDHGLRILLR